MMGTRKDEILGNLGASLAASSAVRARDVGRGRGTDVFRLAVSRIVADPEQPRKVFDQVKLAELAESLKLHGQLQPARVRWDAKASVYVLVAGERRWRAAQLAGLEALDVIILDDGADVGVVRVEQVVENLQRDDLRPSDKARSYRVLMQEWGLNGKQLAARLGVSEGTVSRALSVLKLSPEEQAKLDLGGSVSRAVIRAPRRKAARSVRWSHRVGRGRVVRVEGRPGDDVVQLLEAALAEARRDVATRAA